MNLSPPAASTLHSESCGGGLHERVNQAGFWFVVPMGSADGGVHVVVRLGGVANAVRVMAHATNVRVHTRETFVVTREVPVATVWGFLSPWQVTPLQMEVKP